MDVTTYQNESSPVIFESLYNAPPSRVWKAITDPNEMKQWYFDLPGFQAKPGYKFSFEGGKEDGEKYLHLCEVTEVIQEKKLTYSWRYNHYDGNSFVTFELLPEREKTKLKLTHAGLDSFPRNNPDFMKQNFIDGWTFILGTSLKNYLE